MIDRPAGGEAALVVHVRFRTSDDDERVEFTELVRGAGVGVLGEIVAPREAVDPKFYIGAGKAEEIRQQVERDGAELVLFNRELSPAQERNLERCFGCRVLDRTGLILDIFAQRARSFEGQLQVELAQLQHLSTRLVRGWSHLERQKGGIGLRGPGETQLETDRRLIGGRIRQINERLASVKRRRRQSARARRRALLSTVALVGYTNAGKSTLFNRLTGGEVYAADQLFATLDTTLRTLEVPGEHPVVLSDTVGFIRDLPPELVAAFEATLDETRDAALLLHVIDAADPERIQRMSEVDKVLERIGATGVPVIEVYNKIDQMDGQPPAIEHHHDGRLRRVWLSALSGEGIHLLRQAVGEFLDQHKTRRWLRIEPAGGRLRARLYEWGAVVDEIINEDGAWLLETTLADERWRQLGQDADFGRLVAIVESVPEAAQTAQKQPLGADLKA